MALLFLYLLLSFLSFLPKVYLSCPGQSGTCSGINITFPFFLEASDHPSFPRNSTENRCTGNYMIQCHNGSNPMIQLDGRNYVVRNISYDDKVLILQDKEFSNYLSRADGCGFLRYFPDPINHFHLPNAYQLQNFSEPTLDCWSGSDNIFRTFFAGSNYCINHTYFYWYEPEHWPDAVNKANCVASQPSLFEWMLSFSEADGGLSLQSSGFSHHLNLRRNCFNCKKCDGYDGPVDPSFCHCEKSCKNKSNKKKYIIIGASVGAAFLLACCFFLLWFTRRKTQQQQQQQQQQHGLSNLLSWNFSSKTTFKRDAELGESNYHTHIFSYEELQAATDGFNASREIGDGGFGTVYKGKLRDGRTVAVKRLYEHNYRQLEQFMNEVEILSRLRHQNLVTLYGCTSRHSRELLLVYEYIPNGTVADHLHGPLTSKGALPWSTRMSIAIETADALAYLHNVEPQIIHRDVKSNNILLDTNFHVKVADFGLSRLFPLDATHVSTAPQGTPGYVDPEYHQCYQLTDKSDVYSFGVVLVELISSKPAVDINRHRYEINLANLAVTKIQNCQMEQLVDLELGYMVDVEIKRMINQVAELAFRCLQLDREMRPCIKEVLEGLRGIEGKEVVEVNEMKAKEEARLVKSELPSSPDTVTERWQSMSTTPNEVKTKEEARLVKSELLCSPDTVTERWQSMSTTPNASA